MIRNILTLTLNDLAIAFKNKTLQLVLIIPMFVFFALEMVDQGDSGLQKVNIGLLQNTSYPRVLIDGIESADRVFDVTWLGDAEAAHASLKSKRIDGFLASSATDPGSVELIVLTKASLKTLTIVEGVSAIQDAIQGKRKSWIAGIRPLHDSDLQKQTLPTWILMLVLLVGFIIIPVQVAEEKEKHLLLGLLQTPIREIEWLLAKLLLGIILTLLAAGLLQLLGGFEFGGGTATSYVTILIAAGFCFSASGIFLGFLCRSQASARTLGMLVYLPNLLPAALSEFSQKLNSVAPLLPSFHFYMPMQSILLEGGSITAYPVQLIYLLSVGLVMLCLSWLLMEKRWLM
ncbi:MAG: ABC transporter permease [Porticoccaceae bacterium]|nr:MAG: ABC transporter permease [Porticoccaceae bacterium]